MSATETEYSNTLALPPDPEEQLAPDGFNYVGETRTGRRIAYYVQESYLPNATVQLKAAGIQLDRITPRRVFRFKRRRVPKRADFAALAHQLAEQTEAGVPVVRVCNILGASATNEILGSAVLDVAEQITQGRTLTDAFAMQMDPKGKPLFPVTFINAIRIGETGGETGPMLRMFADAQLKADKVIGSIKSAAIYPLIVLAVSILLAFAFMYMVMPQIASFYTSLLPPGENTLPLPTRIMIGLSNFLLSTIGVVAVVGAVIGLIVAWRWLKSANGRDWLQRHNIHWPVVGQLLRHYHASIILRNIAMLAKSGATMENMLQEAKAASTNPVFAEMLSDVREFLFQESTSLATAFAPYPYLMGDEFSSILVTHENTGNIEDLFSKYASVLEIRVERYVERATKLIEPAMIIGIAGFIFLFVLAVYTPLFQMLGKMAKAH